MATRLPLPGELMKVRSSQLGTLLAISAARKTRGREFAFRPLESFRMSNWFSRLLASKPAASGGLHAPTLIAPYESLVDHGPPIGVRLERPLVYVFEHKILPDAFFQKHPQLMAALTAHQSPGSSFLHMWSKSGTLCCSVERWRLESDEEIEEFWQYAKPLMDSVVCEAKVGTP